VGMGRGCIGGDVWRRDAGFLLSDERLSSRRDLLLTLGFSAYLGWKSRSLRDDVKCRPNPPPTPNTQHLAPTPPSPLIYLPRRPVPALKRALHPAGPGGGVLSREVHTAFRFGDVGDERGHLSGFEPGVVAARPFVFVPAFGGAGFEIGADAGKDL